MQEVEKLTLVPRPLHTFMTENAHSLTVNRWGKFVIYNWVKLHPDDAIPFLLKLKQYDLYHMCTNKQG